MLWQVEADAAIVSELFSYLSDQDRRQASELARLIARRDWVLFVGSGISRPSGLPLWQDLVNRMVQRLGPEAASQDPLEVASLFDAILGRSELVTFLRENLQTLGLGPNPLHNRLLDLRPPVIVTTNFDDLLERALEQSSIPYALVIDDEDLAVAGSALQVIKPHGDLKHWDSLVFTRRDYARYPRQKEVNNRLRTLVAQHAFFCVGYSLNDHDLERQFEKLLDAQEELAKYHYLVVNKVTDLHRSAFLKRNIRVIELGSYDRLEQFLVDLSVESERHRAPTTAQPASIAGSPEALQLDTAEQMLLSLLEVDYAPIDEALQQLRLTDAETRLQQILGKLQRMQQALAHLPGLRDFHQRILLALGTVAVRRKRYEEAQTFYQQARKLQPFAGRRCLQAAEVLIGLGELQEVDTLLADSVEANEPRRQELLGLVALLRNDQARFRALYPTEDGDHLEFALQHARLAVESAQDATAKEALHLLDKAWQLSQDFPPGLLMVAALTDKLLRRLIIEEWEGPGVDRRELLRTMRIHYQQVLTIFEALADQYQEGFVTVLAQLLAFHNLLDEEERQQDLLHRLQSFPGTTRERILAEHSAGVAPPTLDVIEELFQKGHFSFGQKALLMGAALIRDGHFLEAEQLYRQALAAPEPPEERPALIEDLLELMLKEERYEEALAYLEGLTKPEEPFRELMRGMILWSRNDHEGTLTTLRKALRQHPRNIFLLQRLSRFLSTQQHANSDVEALHYAERLETLLPSFEHTLFRVVFLARQGRYQEAFQLVEEVEREGYVTLQVLELKYDLLERLDKNREAAEFLKSYRDRYANNHFFRSKEAISWVKAGEIEQAMTIWEELRHHAEANGDIHHNLVIAYMQHAPQDSSSFSRAFDVAKEALEKFPDRKEFAALLLQASQGCGRHREAWEIIARRPDLYEGPYLRAVSAQEAIATVVKETQALQTLDASYRAGVIPFTTYTARSPRSPLFLWQARSHHWRRGDRTTPLLCGFPRATLQLRQPDIPSSGIVLDMTALLTLGSLNITREILEALVQAGRLVFLFSGARQWLEGEVVRLSMNQLPAYRERHKRLQETLLAARERVDLITVFDVQNRALDASMQQRLGSATWDVETVLDRGYLYMGDHVSPEVRADLPSSTVITSSDLLTALETAGVLFPEDAERIRHERSDLFAVPSTGREVALDRPVMLPWPALVTWFEAGLLEHWLHDQSGWPPKLVVGPTTWLHLNRDVTEEAIYQEALQLARDLRACIVEALDGGQVKELPTSNPPDLGGNPDLRDILAPTLALFAEARTHQLALWTDDLCPHLLVDPLGPLVQESAVVDMAMRVRHAFSEVPVIGTEDILYWLASAGHLPRERRLPLVWQLHRAGYRFLKVGEVLLWLLKRFRYNYRAVPITELLHDLETATSLSLLHVDAKRLRLLIGTYMSGVLSHTIADLWHLTDPALSEELKKTLSTELANLLERTALQ